LDAYNHSWYLLILKTVVKLGLDINDPRMTAAGTFMVRPTPTYEDRASNPWHAYLIFVLFILAFFVFRKLGKSLLLYVVLAASTFLLFSILFKWNGFGTRYDLAFFVIFAPAAGVILGSFDKLKLGYVVVALLFVGSLQWVFGINSRPLISNPRNPLVPVSILVAPRMDLYFANAQPLQPAFQPMASMIKAQGCSDIGVMLRGDDAEYLLWVVMGAPQQQVHFEWIIAGPTDRYSTPNYQPCALVCNGCTEDQTTIRGLQVAYRAGSYWLYLPPAN
jgi:hypothetical protein